MDSSIWTNNQKALISGLITLIISVMSAILIGKVSDFTAQNMLKALIPNINVLCNTVILVCGTILALLFTVLSLSSGVDVHLKKTFYHRIRHVAIFDTILIITATIVFLLLNFPLSEANSLSEGLFQILYYTTLAFISFIGGLIVTVILMLYNTVSDLIKVVEVLDSEEASDEEKEEVKNIVQGKSN